MKSKEDDMTATQHPRRGQVITLAGRAHRALRHVNDEFLLASEAIIRSGRAPADRVTDRADRAA